MRIIWLKKIETQVPHKYQLSACFERDLSVIWGIAPITGAGIGVEIAPPNPPSPPTDGRSDKDLFFFYSVTINKFLIDREIDRYKR